MEEQNNLKFNCKDFGEFEMVSPTNDAVLNLSLTEHLGLNHPIKLLKRLESRSVNGLTIKTDYKAKGNKYNEIFTLIVVSKQNGAVISTYYQGFIADETHFSYDPDRQIITLPNDDGIPIIPNDVEVIYAYVR